MPLDAVLYKSLSIILNQSQDSHAAHAKLVVKCNKIYKEVSLTILTFIDIFINFFFVFKTKFSDFFETFTLIIQGIMINMQKNPNIDRIIDFIAKFASSLSANQNKQDKTIVENAENIDKENAEAADQTQANNSTLKQKSMSESMEDEGEENHFLTSLIDYLIEVSFFCC